MSLLIKPSTDQMMFTSFSLSAMVVMTSSCFLCLMYFFRHDIYFLISQNIHNTCPAYHVVCDPGGGGGGSVQTQKGTRQSSADGDPHPLGHRLDSPGPGFPTCKIKVLALIQFISTPEDHAVFF